ncbi:AIR carboxylase family protein [Candidatus Bathyarchaeota archaeon]|nr:AIR carboxylase family protein [Candidatus Bathyarchaeota archaeon]
MLSPNIRPMQSGKIIVFMGSKRDFEFASRIEKFLQEESFNVECEYLVASAHKTPARLLEAVSRYERTGGRFVFITVAGLSDALSGVVAGSTRYPVIACPPDSEKYGWAKFFSSTVTPRGVAVAYVPRPENAALAAVKVLAISDRSLQEKIDGYMQRLRATVVEGSKELSVGRKDER